MKKKVLIIEDEFIIANSVKIFLEELGNTVVAITDNIKECVDILNHKKVDIALVDINLNSNENAGIEIGHYFKKMQIPFIYTTSYADKETMLSAFETSPEGYIIKPVTKPSLYAQLQLTINKTEKEKISIEEAGKTYILNLDDILYVQAEGNYTTIYTSEKKLVLRKSLKRTSLLLPSYFNQTSKATLVNTKLIKEIKKNAVLLTNDTQVFLSPFYKNKLNEAMMRK